MSLTIKKLKELLDQVPDDARCNAYEGEVSGIRIESRSEPKKHWFIQAYDDDDLDDDLDHNGFN